MLCLPCLSLVLVFGSVNLVSTTTTSKPECTNFYHHVCHNVTTEFIFGDHYLPALLNAFQFLDPNGQPPYVMLVAGLFRECMLMLLNTRSHLTGRDCLNTFHDDHIEVMIRIYVEWFSGGNDTLVLTIRQHMYRLAETVKSSYLNMIDRPSNFLVDAESRHRTSRKVLLLRMLVAFPDFVLNADSVLAVVYGTESNFTEVERPVTSFEQLQRELLVGDFYKSRQLLLTHKEAGIKRLIPYMQYRQRNQFYEFKQWKDVSPRFGSHYWSFEQGDLQRNIPFREGRNLLFVPLTELDNPMFDVQYPPAVNYGILGSIVGHEIGHSIDMFEADAYLRLNWTAAPWSRATLQEYKRRAQCLVDQFSRLPFDPDNENETLRVNGLLTLMENTADLSGLIATFEALKQINHFDDPLLHFPPNTSQYTPEQIFFLSYARSNCVLPHHRKDRRTVDVRHSPSWHRVNEVLKNMPQFADTFQCPLGSAMNPAKKCRFW